jgi:hypothetical protein
MDCPSDDLLQRLARLVVKDGVSLGGLPTAQQTLALAWVWAGLDVDRVSSEPEINRALKKQLAGAAVWLGVDHVELRRWLVDAGWLQRDGFGREYRRVNPPALAPPQQALAKALMGMNTESWVAERRATQDATRQARRQAWVAAQGPGT